jgi:uncharacterized damage-inducible protein DinB
MKIIASDNLAQLQGLLEKISDDTYRARPAVLFGASIGEHYRHILEFYLLLVSGSFTGLISYDRRERDARIATDINFAKATIKQIESGLETLELDLLVHLETDFSNNGESEKHLPTSLGRELAYCVEHSIHHQAIIKAGLIDLGCIQLVDDHFGVAYSTMRFRNQSCAQ